MRYLLILALAGGWIVRDEILLNRARRAQMWYEEQLFMYRWAEGKEPNPLAAVHPGDHFRYMQEARP